ncbi:MFS transporter [Fusibacter ferrireducens]|uniref:MFS transporter n=1 Tax=Fusibacter ferrireducens TaxID=2785058 RepID=A0ABR9ZY31_9FIRM|nr:MFS transporter [Fusibacter ferrireducens]MBF4694861.1 MFS transporter [Fusibacter ferrireducens]
MESRNREKEIKLYVIIIAITAFGLGLSNAVMSNYFKDAYQVDAFKRGLIEFPREIPGIISVFVIAMLSFISDIKIAMIAQLLSFVGIMVLGFITPSFNIMLLFIFINSLGMHLFFPLQDSIGMDLAGQEGLGKKMGRFKGVFTAFQMLSAVLVFVGFKTGFFTFTSERKWIFILAGFLFLCVFILLFFLERSVNVTGHTPQKLNFTLRKEYKYYYYLVILFGVQKQIMMVYGPWVLIDLLGKKADTLALIGIVGAFIGIFFMTYLGKWIDQFGIKKMLYVDALSFIGVYAIYGFLSAGYVNGSIKTSGIGVLLAYGILIIDRMSTQMGLIRTLYLKSISKDKNDITHTLTLGQSLDHFVSIICAILGGVIWVNFGPQYIFFLAAFISLGNLYIAVKVKIPTTVD